MSLRVITWEYGRRFKTKGLDPDQTVAAMMATEKMLNIMDNHPMEIHS